MQNTRVQFQRLGAVSFSQICRTCLNAAKSMCPITNAVVNEFDGIRHIAVPIVDMLKRINSTMIHDDKDFPAQVCADCLVQIQQSYSFLHRCRRSEDILKGVKHGNTKLKAILTVNPADQNRKCITKQNNFVDDQTPCSTITPMPKKAKFSELNGNATTKQKPILVAAQANAGNLVINAAHISQPKVSNFDDDKLPIEIVHDVSTDEYFSIQQDIKQEPELEIPTESNGFDDEMNDEPKIERVKCPGCPFQCVMIATLERHIIENHIENKLCKLCNRDCEFSANQHVHKHLPANPEKQIQCSVCLKIFGSKLAYDLHSHELAQPFRIDIHSETDRTVSVGQRKYTQKFECVICQVHYAYKKVLERHMRRMHNKVISE